MTPQQFSKIVTSFPNRKRTARPATLERTEPASVSVSTTESEVPRQLKVVILSIKQKFIARLAAPIPPEPNQAPEPTIPPVTVCADAQPAPAGIVAHLKR